MAQIPVFGGSQRIEPGTPVGAVSTEAARLPGEAAAGLGKAMFDLGNMLDQTAKKAKEETDRIKPGIAKDKYALELLKQRAKIEAEGLQPGDDPSGVDAINRLQERMEPFKEQLAAELDDDKQRGLFLNSIGEVNFQQSTIALATEVKKREENVQILRQENIRTKGEAARLDHRLTGQMLSEIEVDVMNDASIPDAKKLDFMLNAKKSIASDSIDGLIEKGRSAGTMRVADQYFAGAREQLKGLQNVFKQDEFQKQLKSINDAEIAYYKDHKEKTEYLEVMRKREVDYQDELATGEYLAALKDASNDTFKFNAVLDKMEGDGRLKNESYTRLAQMNIFAERADDRYEGVFYTKLYKNHTKAHYDQMRKDLNNDFLGTGKNGVLVSADRRNKLLKAIEDAEKSVGKNPNIGRALSQMADQIGNSGPGAFDPAGFWRPENKQFNETLQTQFWVRINAAGPDITAADAEKIKDNILASVKRPGYGDNNIVMGVSPNKLSTPEGVAETRKQLAQKYYEAKKRGDSRAMQEATQQMRQLKPVEENVKRLDQYKVDSVPSKGARVIDQ